MPPPRRPTAFEVSFPREAAIEAQETERKQAQVQADKRKNTNDDTSANFPTNARSRKRARSLHSLKPCNYVPKAGETKETNLIVVGEDDDQQTVRIHDKPVRILSNFVFFDTTHDLEMVSLSALEEGNADGSDRVVEGAGYVVPLLLNEEDDGQLDIDNTDIRNQQYARLSTVIRLSINYTTDDPVFVETEYAIYQLQSPLREYKPFFRIFYRPHRVAQVVLSKATEYPNLGYDRFLKRHLIERDIFLQEKILEGDIEDAIPIIKNAIEDHENSDDLLKVPFLEHILRDVLPHNAAGHRRRRQAPRRQIDFPKRSLNDIDLDVLRPEKQTCPCVTSLIASLAAAYFRKFIIVGPRPVPPDKNAVAQQKRQKRLAFSRLQTLIKICFRPRRTISSGRERRLSARSNWLRSVLIDGEQYEVGDTVVIPIGQYGTRKAPDLPHPDRIPADSSIEDHFWFAKIRYISDEHETAHVHWFWHSSMTAIGEISDHQELFLSELCDTIKLQAIVGKVTVHCWKPGSETNPKVEHDEFFYRFTYDSFLATYTDIDHDRIAAAADQLPPNNCPVCHLVRERDQEMHGQRLPTGIAYLGMNFHIHDFVLIRTQRHTNTEVTVKLLGRVNQLTNIVLPDMVKDERHLFLTDQEECVKLEALIRICYVFPHVSIPEGDFDLWTSISPDHFYAKYRFPSMNVRSWGDRRALHQEIDVCAECCREEVVKFNSMKSFLPFAERAPLRALDLFGGVGTFGLGIAECKGLKVTHAVEISPSAARTLGRNSSETVVYNACANDVLRYAVKSHNGHEVEKPVNVFDKTPLPDPPSPGDVEVILAGFPCQSHSTLNMFRKADDPKSNLILTTLSWIDFMRPKLCVLENVRGFLQFNLSATQVSKHKVKGGIEMGGLKLVVRALICMNYQIRFGLLQAGHYGIPQTRVRFFLIAVQSGYPLPELPQPSHEFPVNDALAIKLPIGDTIRPIRTALGTAPHPFVTVEDAIGDLPRFDWKNPGQARESIEKRREARERERDIPAIVCSKVSPYCGYEGPVQYGCEPKTTYQQRSRKKDTRDLQQYTRSLIPSKVERVCNIPLRPKADYLTMRRDLHEWQLVNPASAVARGGFSPGWYGRLDKDGWFSTTVTNVDPTAKQSKVLHPYCKRMVTVRELARSQGFPDHFVFESVNDKVVTMHRQIGNAVSWLVAVAIGREIQKTVFNRWLKEKSNAKKVQRST